MRILPLENFEWWNRTLIPLLSNFINFGEVLLFIPINGDAFRRGVNVITREVNLILNSLRAQHAVSHATRRFPLSQRHLTRAHLVDVGFREDVIREKLVWSKIERELVTGCC